MQELQAGRLFVAGGSSAAEPEVRCPRCDSANTKFCYYNNYNLAQPRHFCKACRRYWTKGGLLRNVPVGGGCRKPKPAKRAAPDAGAGDGDHPRGPKNPRVGCHADAPATSPSAPPGVTVTHQPSGPISSSFAAGDTMPLPPPAPMFANQAAAFASLFAPAPPPPPPLPPPLPAFGFSAQHRAEERGAEQSSPASAAGAKALDAPQSSCGLTTTGPSDWPSSAPDAGMFEPSLPPAYWNAEINWTDSDPTIYLP